MNWNDLKIRIRFEPVKIRYLINSPTKPITETASLAYVAEFVRLYHLTHVIKHTSTVYHGSLLIDKRMLENSFIAWQNGEVFMNHLLHRCIRLLSPFWNSDIDTQRELELF